MLDRKLLLLLLLCPRIQGVALAGSFLQPLSHQNDLSNFFTFKNLLEKLEFNFLD